MKRFAFSVVILLVASLACVGQPKGKETEAQKAARQEAERKGDAAWNCGRKSCLRALKSPSTAKFSSLNWDSETGWAPYGYQQWRVYGWVDAENSFGAKLRQKWMGVVRMEDDAYVTIYLRMGDQESGKMPGVSVAPPKPKSVESITAEKAVAEMEQSAAKDRALKQHQKLADEGDAYGLFRMGERYMKGDGVEKDEVKGRNYLEKAAAAGSEGAKELLKSTHSLTH